MTVRTFFPTTHPINQLAMPATESVPQEWFDALIGSAPFRIEAGTGSLFHVPTYSAKDATDQLVLTQFAWAARDGHPQLKTSGNLLWGTYVPTIVPWNPAWAWPKTSQHTDRTIIIIDEATGQVWELWKLGNDDGTLKGHDAAFHIPNWWAAQWAEDRNLPWASVGSSSTWKSVWTRKWDSKRIGVRGCGLDKPAGIVRLEELEAGRINHTINLTISTTGLGFRWPATRSEAGAGAASGVDIGNGQTPAGPRAPSGCSFLLDPAYIPSSCPPVTRMVLEAMVNRAVTATETCGWGGHVETDWRPDQAARWAKLGVTTADRNAEHNQILNSVLTTPGALMVAKQRL